MSASSFKCTTILTFQFYQLQSLKLIANLPKKPLKIKIEVLNLLIRTKVKIQPKISPALVKFQKDWFN